MFMFMLTKIKLALLFHYVRVVHFRGWEVATWIAGVLVMVLNMNWLFSWFMMVIVVIYEVIFSWLIVVICVVIIMMLCMIKAKSTFFHNYRCFFL